MQSHSHTRSAARLRHAVVAVVAIAALAGALLAARGVGTSPSNAAAGASRAQTILARTPSRPKVICFGTQIPICVPVLTAAPATSSASSLALGPSRSQATLRLPQHVNGESHDVRHEQTIEIVTVEV